MNWPTRILCAVVLGTAVSLIAVVSRQNLLTPRQILEQVEAELGTESYDEQLLLRRLSSCLRRAETEDLSQPATRELCSELLMARGKLFLEIGATKEARTDFEEVLKKYNPGDREVRHLLIQAESAAGDVVTALTHLDELLEEEPDFVSAMVEKGQLQQRLATEALETCSQKLRNTLIEADAQRASEMLHTLAARDPLDPARATIILELKKLFPPSADESLGQVLGFCEEASKHLAGSREAYVKSLSYSLDTVALTHYLEILEAAGRTQEALQLGSIIALAGPDRADPSSALLLIRMQMDRGDYAHAAQITSNWIGSDQPLGIEFLRVGCEVLYRTKDWPKLLKAANRLRSIGSHEDGVVCTLYSGMAYARSSKPRPSRALTSLLEFVHSRNVDPFPEAREKAWREIARLQKDAGSLSREREAIQAVLGQGPKNAGALWLRRAEIQLATPHNGYRLPLDSWARGMSLLPRRTDELMEQFIELGELTLKAEERNIQSVFEDLKISNRTFPTRNYGPYVLFRIAQLHGEENNYEGQLATARGLLARLPNFVPALDLMIEARHELGDRLKFIDLVLQRIELAGMSPRTKELVGSIRIDEYTNPQLVQIMQADPRGVGRMVVTRWFYENGENAKAIETLETSSRKDRTDEERIFGARIHMADNRDRFAMRWLDEIEAKSPFRGIKLRLAVSCAMKLGDTEEILRRITELLNDQDLRPDELLVLTDECLRTNQHRAAKLLMDRVSPKDVPEPGVFMKREVLLALRDGDEKVASAVIERAGSFMSDAEYLVARLLLDGMRGDWTRAQENALELRQTGPSNTPLVDLLVDILAGENQRAFDNTQFGLQLTPLVPRWIIADNIARLALDQEMEVDPAFGVKGREDLDAFLNGREDELVDPRLLAVLLIASEFRGFEPLVQATISEMEGDSRGVIWPLMIQAELQSQVGQNASAVKTYEQILRSNGDCLPAWAGLETVLTRKYGSSSHPQVAGVRARMLLSLAKADPNGSAGLLINARRLKRRGDLASSLRLTLNALQLAPDWFEARYAVADIYTEMGHWQPALEEWRVLVADSSASEAPRSVAGYIRALGRASVSEPPVIDVAQIKAELDLLNQAHPDNPRVVLALAHIDLLLDQHNPALGLDRAWSRLQTLRENHGGISLEEMQRGATQAWATFYVETDPDSAEDFILAELQRQPGNLFLWRLLGRVQRELDKFVESIEFLTRVALMVPSVEVQMELASSYTAYGVAPQTVAKILRKAKALRGGEESLEGQMLTAESVLNGLSARSLAAAIELLKPIWENRHQLDQRELRTHLAALYGRALILREGPGDARRALKVLNSELQNTDVPYQREYFTCLLGLGHARDPVKEL